MKSTEVGTSPRGRSPCCSRLKCELHSGRCASNATVFGNTLAAEWREAWLGRGLQRLVGAERGGTCGWPCWTIITASSRTFDELPMLLEYYYRARARLLEAVAPLTPQQPTGAGSTWEGLGLPTQRLLTRPFEKGVCPMGSYLSGTGAPEGAITAGVGTLWAQTDGANGALTWRKTTPTGNTGWEELQSTGEIRPEAYGAKGDEDDSPTGNPTATDDTTAIQNAINAAISAKKMLLFTKKYKIIGTLTVNGSLLIEGSGYESMIRQRFVRGAAPNNNAPNVLTITGGDVIVRNLRIRGDNGTTGDDIAKNHGIYVNGASRLRIIHCWIHRAESAGIRVCDAKDVLIEGCFLFDNVAFRYDPAPNFSYDSCDIGLSTGSCVNRRVTIANNHCLSDNSQGIYVNATNNDSEVKVIGNTCVATDSSGNEITSTVIKRRHGILTTYAGGLNGGRIVVAHNICRNTRWTGIYYVAGTNPSSPVLITGNSISRVSFPLDPGQIASAQGGIMLNAEGDGSIVSNNIVEEITIGPGIGLAAHLANAKGETLIANNVVRGCAQFESAAVYVEGRPQNALITGNVFVDNVGRDVIVGSAVAPPDNVIGDVTIRGNFVRKMHPYDMFFVAAND